MTKKIKTSAIGNKVTNSHNNAELVAIQALRGYFEGYLEASALAILFNLSMREKEQKKFKEYVEYVSYLTNGFETQHTVEYNTTSDYEIMWEWGEYVDKHYKGNNKSEVYDFYFSDNSNIIDKKQIVSEWLEEFAADMRVNIENVTVSFGRKFVYVTGYSK